MSEKSEDTNKPMIEDWAMDAPQTAKTETASAKNDEWKMPEPVFRVSDGTTHGSQKTQMPPNQLPTQAAPQPEQTVKEENPLAASGIDIQPQPYLPEELNINQIMPDKPAESKNGVPKIIFGVFGIVAMALFAIVFLIGVYFLFFYKSQE
ncbi:MAG: hypothetical protein M3033_17290 [Acidobacteriota bacterium]|nr:hypothetical protein [Acidobacteriota bacterium]